MLNRMSVLLTNSLLLKTSHEFDDKRDHIRYAIETLLSELSKFIILCVFFILLDKGSSFFFAFCYFSFLRTFSGGLHFDTYVGCLIGTLTLYSAMVWFPITGIFNTAVIFLFLFITTLIFVPLPDIKRPIKDKKKRYRLKSLTVIFAFTIYYIILHFTPHYLNQYYAATIVFCIQLFIGGFRYEKAKRRI